MTSPLTSRQASFVVGVALFIFPLLGQGAEPTGTSEVYLDAATVQRGYVVMSADREFRLHIPPAAIPEASVTVRAFSATEYQPPSDEWRLASPVYVIEVHSSGLKQPLKPLWVEFPYPEDQAGLKAVAVFHAEVGEWERLPTRREWSQRRLRAAIPWTFGRFALLESTNTLELGTASWYRYRGCLCAASPDYPKRTKLKVTNRDNGASVVVRINDYGPDRTVFPERVIDLDDVAFRQLRHPRHGLVKVLVEPVPTL